MQKNFKKNLILYNSKFFYLCYNNDNGHGRAVVFIRICYKISINELIP